MLLRDEEVVERRALSSPAGFGGELVVGVREVGVELHGYVELASAGVGRCYVAVFQTVVRGPHRDEELGRRLAVIVEEAFEKVRVRDVEERAAE